MACGFDWSVFWTMIGALATIGVARIAYRQLNKFNKISMAEFAHKCENNFFISETRQLFMLFENDLMIFRKTPLNNIEMAGETEPIFAYFEIDQSKLKSNPILSSFISDPQRKYSSYEIDDLLLGPLDNVGTYYREKLMDIRIVKSFFRYYIVELYKNRQIKDYIDWNNTLPGGKDTYKNFIEIHNELET